MFLGDPAVVSVPLDLLTDKAYAARLRAGITERARPSSSIRTGVIPREGQNTTHFSVIDAAGNAVANTYTLNLNFGVGLVADGTGILLNNELDDFSAKPGAPNAFGLVGGDANAPASVRSPRWRRPSCCATAASFSSPARPAAAASSPWCCR